MVSQYQSNIIMSWANTGLPLSNQFKYSGFILVIFWPYTVLPILAQYKSHVQTITKLYWTNIGPIWDTGMSVLDQTWHNYTANTGPILVQYNHAYWDLSMFEIHLDPVSNLKKVGGYFVMLLTDVCCWAG